jgi:hypothetical protein
LPRKLKVYDANWFHLIGKDFGDIEIIQRNQGFVAFDLEKMCFFWQTRYKKTFWINRQLQS